MSGTRKFYWLGMPVRPYRGRVPSVREVTHQLLEQLGMTTIFGNPGSNELPFLVGLPDTFRYVLGLHEGVVTGMADGFAQATGGAAFVNLHAASGTGNAMGALTNAAVSRSPLVISAGQQVRGSVGLGTHLANSDATMLTRPLTVFEAEPLAAEDVPRTFSQAYHEAVSGHRGPTYVSVPYDDWAQPAGEGSELVLGRSVSRESRLPTETIEALAERLRGADSPALVLGSDLDGLVPMDDLVRLADGLDAAVWGGPSLYRLPFPNRHRRFRGVLPAGIASVHGALQGHDLVVVLGAPVFRYHQHEPGAYLPEGTRLVQVTDDPAAAARAPFGESVIADPGAVVADLLESLGIGRSDAAADPADYCPCPPPAAGEGRRLSPAQVFAALRETQPPDTAFVVESTSTISDFWQQMDLRHPGSYYFPASGGLGFGMPAAVGVALARPDRRVVGIIGDGSANYGITALWTAAQLRLPLTFVILRNGTYGALRWFAGLLDTPDVPGMDIPDIDFVAIAEGYGVRATTATTVDDLRAQLATEPTAPRLIQVDTILTTPQ